MATINAIADNVERKPAPAATSLDNLLRRELRVADPRDPKQIADALMQRYQHDNRARAIKSEGEGLPLLTLGMPSAQRAAQASATDLDYDEAVNDINRDLTVLQHSHLLKDHEAELSGWAQAIRDILENAGACARQALDRQQRDTAFSYRRQLNDYARLARMAGLLTPSVNEDYRSLAQSLDELANVLLVIMGEALAQAGVEAGDYFPQAPMTELESRRSAVIAALRNLTAVVETHGDKDDWPWGLNAYGRLLKILNDEGQAELRALMHENELARVLDDLIHRAGDGFGDGLRALGSTAQIELNRLRRLIRYWKRIPSRSGSLAMFMRALQLFVEAFDPAAGSRMLVIARPPILFYGLSRAFNTSSPQYVLQQLAMARAMFAHFVDSYMIGSGSVATLKDQVLLDKTLYGLDRAIDLYCQGTGDEDGHTEYRALAYWLFYRELPDALHNKINDNQHNQLHSAEIAPWKNDWVTSGSSESQREAAYQELINQYVAEADWWRLLQGMSSHHHHAIELKKAVIETLKKAAQKLGETLPASDQHSVEFSLPLDIATALTVQNTGTADVM